MSLIIPFVIAGICSIAVLTYLYFYLYFQYRERYILLWAYSWLICLLEPVFIILVISGMPPVLVIGDQVSSLLSGVILLWGTHVFQKKNMPRHWVYGCMLGIAWISAGVLSGIPLLWQAAPIYLFLGAVYIRAGLLFLGIREMRGTGRRVTGLALIAWGLHKFDYPFLRTVDSFALWGYVVAYILALTVAIGFLLVYFHKIRSDLAESESRFRLLAENARDIIYRYRIDPPGFDYISPAVSTILGYKQEELCSNPELARKIIHPEDCKQLSTIRQPFLSQPETLRMVHKNGMVIWFEQRLVPVLSQDGSLKAVEGIARDISGRKKAEDALRTSEEKYRLVVENASEAIITYDMEGRITFCNNKSREILGYRPEDLVKMTLFDLADPDQQEVVKDILKRRLEKGELGSYEILVRHSNGSQRMIKINSSPIIEDGKITGGIVLAEDITDRKRAEEQLRYLSLHDSLTGLYNRTYFEQEMRRLEGGRLIPAGIILCDVDGLKLVNDTLGHGFGDSVLVSAARVIRESFREGDMVARIGGDEFAVLLPGASRDAVEKGGQRIREAVARHNHSNPGLPLSISVGLASGSGDTANMHNLFKEADNGMYREKLHRNQSARSAIVQTLMSALEARDFITEGHADRLQNLVEDLARTISLPEQNISDLRLLARFHDIGKVGIPDRILFKPGRLSPGEKAEMQRHCEIGHRIAQSSPDLSPIADWILKHHEWWNGRGYPLGLRGIDIPIECRILAIADAYDSMTNDRPYRKAMSGQQAAAELESCAGTQFDPDMVQVFLEVLNNK